MGDDETQQPGYAERDDSDTTQPSGAGGAGEDEPQGGEHFGEAPLGGDAEADAGD